MFIVGHRQRTETFDGARESARPCERCDDFRLHHEKRVVHSATAFFVPVANVRTQYVWICSACQCVQGPSDRDPKWAGPQQGTLTGSVVDAMGSAAEVANPAVTAAVDGATNAVRAADIPGRGRQLVRGLWSAVADDAPTADDAPVVEDAVEIDG